MINNLSFEIKDAYLVAIYANTTPECEVILTFLDKEDDQTVTARVGFDNLEDERNYIMNIAYLGGHYHVTGKYKLKESRTLVVDTETVRFEEIERG